MPYVLSFALLCTRGEGSNFTLVRQNLWTLLNVWKNVATHRHIGYLKCTMHNQHARHANAIGDLGHANAIGDLGHAPRKILKSRYSEIEFGDILGLDYNYKSF